MEECGVNIKNLSYEDQRKQDLQKAVKKAQTEKFDVVYSELWEDVAELIEKPLDEYRQQSQEDQYICKAFAKYGDGSRVLEATRHALSVMVREDEYRLMRQNIEPVPSYGVKRLFGLIDKFEDRSGARLVDLPIPHPQPEIARDTASFSPPAVEHVEKSDKSISFCLSPSPMKSSKNIPSGFQQFGNIDITKKKSFNVSAKPQVAKTSQKTEGLILSKPSSNKKAVSTPKVQVPETSKKPRYPSKPKNLDTSSAGRILATVPLKETYGQSNDEFFSKIAKEFGINLD